MRGSGTMRKLAQARKEREGTAGNEKKSMTVEEVESVFIEKFQEKYKLTTRDIKRAFAFYDYDGSGFLDPMELTDAISHFVNGVDKELVKELVSNYDIDGNGNISLDEFTHFLLSRTGPRDDWITVAHLRQHKSATNKLRSFEDGSHSSNRRALARSHSHGASHSSLGMSSSYSGTNSREQHASLDTASDIHRPVDPADVEAVEYATKMYLGNVKTVLLRRAREIWRDRKVNATRLKSKGSEVIDEVAQDIFMRAFQGFGHTNPVDFSSFKGIISGMKPKGTDDPDEAVVEMMFAVCLEREGDDVHASEADVARLCDVIFNKGGMVVNRFGFGQHVPAPTNTGRPEVARGPYTTKFLEYGRIEDLPHRVLTDKCRTSMAAPSDLSMDLLRRSAQVPSWKPYRDHVYGLNAGLYQGSTIQALDTSGQKVCFASAALGVVHDVHANQQYFFEGHTDDISCLTVSNSGLLAASGQVGRRPFILVWSTERGASSLSTSAGSLDPRGDSSTRVSSALAEAADAMGLVSKCGEGFFRRAINAVQFSGDARYIVGVGCDDHCTLGVFSTTTGDLLVDASCANGSPPMVHAIAWCDTPHATEYITSDHLGNCECFVTAGFRHLKFWSFKPIGGKQAVSSLRSRTGRLGSGVGSGSSAAKKGAVLAAAKGISKAAGQAQTGAGLPKCHRSVTFLPPEHLGGITSVDVVSGGDNGNIYLFKQACCTRIVPIIPAPSIGPTLPGDPIVGGVRVLVSRGQHLFCAGGKGQIVILAANTFVEQARYVVAPSGSSMRPQQGVGSIPARAVPGKPSSRQPTPHRPLSGARYPTTQFAYRPKSAGFSGEGNSGGFGGGGGEVSRESKRKVNGPKDEWGGEKDPSMLRPVLPEGTAGTADITGMVLVEAGRGSRGKENVVRGRGSAGVFSGVDTILVSTAFGKALKVHLCDSIPRGLGAAGKASGTVVNPVHEPLFYYHYGPVWAVAAVSNGSLGDTFLTGGDDRWLCLWDVESRRLLCRAKSQAPVRCLHFAGNSNYFAMGTAGGIVGFYLADIEQPQSQNFIADPNAKPTFSMTMLACRKDCKKDISDVKFSPDTTMLAVGSHECDIDLYSIKIIEKNPFKQIDPEVQVSHVRKLYGHRAYIKHVDWDAESRLVRSTCGAYEIIMWDAETGKKVLSRGRSTESDIKWATFTSPLGFGVMGVWPEGADGTDINGLDVSFKKNLVVTADDFGQATLLNYPSVIEHAPGHVMGGHSSHVMNVRFAGQHHDFVVTVGGSDCTAQMWLVTRRNEKGSGMTKARMY